MSHTFDSPHKTGIQRVVRSLQRELPKVAAQRGLEFMAVVWYKGAFVDLETVDLSPQTRPWIERIRANVLEHCPASYRLAATWLCNRIPSQRLRKLLLPQPGKRGVFHLPIGILSFASIGLRRPGKHACRPAPQLVETTDQDLIIMPDGYWVMMHIWPAVAAARERGTRIAVIIHDAICITHPHFFSPHADEIFTAFLREVCLNADVVCSVSETVKLQLDEMLPDMTPAGFPIPYRCFSQNGAEFSRATGKVRPDLARLCATKESPIYLMVSTFEPRKNHTYVLDAFDQYWQTHPEGRLIMVGAVGWMCEPVIERIKKHSQLGKRLFVYHDLTDAEVAQCYAKSSAVIFPSHVEGFGLPIVESLWHGKKTFAGNTAISREVGGDACEYFELEDPSSLVQLLANWEAKGCPAGCVTKKPHNWQQSAETLLDQVFRGLEQGREIPLRKAS